MRNELEVTYCNDGLLMAMIGPVCLAIWQKKPTRPRFEIQRAHLAAAVKKNPGSVAFVCIVEPGTEPPDDAERKASSTMITSHGTDLKCVACVVEGTGFKAAITRTVLSGIMLLTRTSSPMKYFESAIMAAPWLRQYVSLGPDVTFVRLVEAARAELNKTRSNEA